MIVADFRSIMKKLFLMGAVASLGLLASCSSDDDLSTGGNGKDGLQQIKIGMGVQANVATRGTGTVGAVGAENNTWAKQTVNVYMLNKGTLDLAKFGEDPIYENTVLTTPADNASGIATELVEGVPQYKYYPTTKTAFDFWGYRLDDADATTAADQEGSATAAAIKSNKFVPYTSGDSLLIGFNIDGTQDIMAGKAVPTEEEIAKCGGEDNIYSAFAARRDVQPNIKFEHLLSRLNFQVLAGAESTTDANTGVKVTGITVKSKATGKLVIAYKGAETTFANVSDQLIVDKYADEVKEAALYKDLVVKQRAASSTSLTDNLVDLDPVTPKWNNGMAMATQVGEALLAIPADKYEITINLKQKVQVKGDKGHPTDPDDFQEKEYTYTADLKNTVNPEKGFEPGYSYNVTITVYGLSEIQITTTLIPWKDGGNIEMNPEDETFGATTTNNAYEWAEIADPTTTGATVEPTTYATVEALKAAVAANASNSGKIYKVGSTETDWTYYQCKVKVVTPAPTVKYEFDTYEFQEGDVVEAGEFADLDALKDAVTADDTTEGKIYKVGTSEPYSYYKVTKHVTGA